MKLKALNDSVFGALLRSPWWISAGIALVFVVGAISALPPTYWAVGVFGSVPFAVIAILAAWRQLRAPSASQVETVAAAMAGMPWSAFAGAVQAGFERDGCQVERLSGGADFALTKGGHVALVSAKRWKAARTGVEPVRELQAARERRGAREAIYIALGDISPSARDYAAKNGIAFMTAPELAKLLRGLKA
ncbi:restriction endonuclease [Achromobacter aloeverae]|uniref:Restriction endonuclease n=1 Tax=Achromobacter aloeverae TaxID=1750518 RepID=A0A4Q1HDP6_9BURK|nr:restriction endonuclease [Achromobacter aloeverae]RXN83331.1 restriction endonuclease [Achromobacter aloeverae]